MELVHMELSRGDGGPGMFVGVQVGLVVQSIGMLGVKCLEDLLLTWSLGLNVPARRFDHTA
jgi:hypothetical protein